MKRHLYIILALLIITGSCTIQKRVHRKGWHVEWRKVRTSSPATSVNQETEQLSFNENNSTPLETSPASRSTPDAGKNDINNTISQQVESLNYSDNEIFEQSTIENESGYDAINENNSSSQQEHSSLNSTSSQNEENNVNSNDYNVGVILIILGALCLLGGAILFIILLAFASASEALLAFIIAGFLLLIGLIFLMLGVFSLSNSNVQKKKEEEEESVPLTPEETERKEKSKRREPFIVAGFVIVILSIIGLTKLL